MTVQSITQIVRRNKRQSLEAAKRLAFEAQVNRLAESGALDNGMPLAQKVHKLLLANRPGALAELPAPVDVEAQAAPVLFDLLIATKKYGYGSNTGSAESAPILWIKFAGEEKRPPKDKTITMAAPGVQKFLQGYELVANETRQFEMICKYRKVGE
jgi:hypothetical protein